MGDLGWDAAVTEALANSRETTVTLCTWLGGRSLSSHPPSNFSSISYYPAPPRQPPLQEGPEPEVVQFFAPNNQLLLQA